MADDISKKITIEVEAETEKLKQDITSLNQTLDNLLLRQKQLVDSGKQNTKVFEEMATQVKAAQAALELHGKAVDTNVKALNTAKASLAQNKDAMADLLAQYDKLSRAEGDHSKNANALNLEIGKLTNTITDQEEKLTKSRDVFDAHKSTVNALTSSFNKLKGVSGTFGPSLQEAADGFDALKSGLSIVKTGFTSVGDAIKTTGFGLLVLVLQSVVDYFTKTTEGSKKLKGGISAIGKVIEIIHKAFASFGKAIIDAVTHPVDSLKALGNAIKENVINRFKAFSVILDGIVHLDFKKVGNGVIQAFTGVTNATDKISSAFNTAKKDIKNIAGEVVEAYNKGSKAAASNEKVIKKLTDAQKKYNNEVNKTKKDAEEGQSYQKTDDGAITTSAPGTEVTSTTNTTLDTNNSILPENTLKNVIVTEGKISQAKKEAFDKLQDYYKQSMTKLAADGLNIVTNAIKAETDAKVAALEKDKAAELTNTSLTSAQKLAINQKYKQEEGKIKLKAFKEEQEAAIAQALINGAVAVTKVEAQTGVLGELTIPIIIAQTALQVAAITSKKPPAYAQGGLHYQSDGRGGVLPGYSKYDNTNAFLRSGEGVVVSEAMQVPWARNLVSAINVGFGGRDFAITNPGGGYAVGGIFTDGGDANRYYNQPVADQKNLANTIAYQMINNFPPVYVDVKDVNNQQNILAQTINRVNL